MSNIKKQISFYTGLLKEGELLLLKSKDNFFKNHYNSSPLNILTNFSGTAGEAVIDKTGKITLFVDTRYHLLADKEVYPDIKIYKMQLGETFFDAFRKCYKKDTVLYVESNALLSEYLELDKYFDLRKYHLKKEFLKNEDFNKKSPIIKIDKKIENLDFNSKIQKLKNANPEVSKILIFNLDEIAYFTGLRSFQVKYSSNFRSILYLDFKTGNNILFADKISKKIKINNLKFFPLNNFVDYIKAVNEKIYLDSYNIPFEYFLAINHPEYIKKNNIPLISSIKQKSEIGYMKNCFEKLDKAIENFQKKIKSGLSEFDLAQIFENELLNEGAKCLSFKTILAFDNNSASIHYSSYDKNKILKPESLILLDCGGYWEGGYATDITRTFYYGKKPELIYKKIYTDVLKAFIACFLSNETNAKKLDNTAREMLKNDEKYGFYFNHGLGHGIGTSVHQNPPLLSIASKDIIRPYQIHSIEPGLYGKSETDGVEFGVRIENCVFFDINYKRYSLSKFPFEELLIDYNDINSKEKEFIDSWQKGLINGNN